MRNLSNFPEEIKEHEIIIDNIPISICLKRFYISQDLIVFFHGLGCSKEIFENALTHPVFKRDSLLLFDFAGFGKSGKPADFSYSMEDQAKICEKLLMHFPKVRLHIVAHSMGGAIPLLFSDYIYERIDSFANLEGNLTGADCGLFSRNVIKVSFEEYAGKKFEEDKIKFSDIIELKFDETTPYAMYRSSKSLVDWSDSEKLAAKFKLLNCRKAYFYGEKSQEQYTIKALEDIRKIMIPNAGHSMMLDNGNYFYRELHKFIFEDK